MKGRNKPFLVCLTGGVASGKSTVSALFEKLSVEVIDTDVLAREVVQPKTIGLKKIVKEFGRQIVKDNGSLNRKALRKFVFHDDTKRKRLNAIIHPLILSRVMEDIGLAKTKFIVVVIPLYTGQKEYGFFDRVCVVDINEHNQLMRLKNRDKISIDLAQKMIDSQLNRECKIALADDVIGNNGDESSLVEKAKDIHCFYKSMIESQIQGCQVL